MCEQMSPLFATYLSVFLTMCTIQRCCSVFGNAVEIVMSLVETAKANNLNAYKYLYTLLLYMPDYKNEPAGIEQLLPWSTFVQDKCSGIIDDSLELPENRGNLPIYGFLVRIPVWLFIAYNLSTS